MKRTLIASAIVLGTFLGIGIASASLVSQTYAPPGSNGTVLTASSSATGGADWETVSGGGGGVSTSSANTWSALQTFNAGLSAASVTLPYTNASGTFSYSLKNDGNYLEINDTTGTIPGTSPVPYNIILQNCPPVGTTSVKVTSSSWECALSQAENFPDGSRSFVDWDTEYYPTGTGANVASGWFDNKRGTSSILFPFDLSWNDGSVNHVGFSMTPATNTSASNFNTLVNNGTGYFTVGTASSTTGAFDVYQNGANTCAGIYDSGASTIYGFTDSLPGPAGCTALAGYYHGLAIGGSSSGTGSPIFGVLNSSQSSNGKGHTALTVYDTNEVDTFNNTLDDGNGNAIVSSTLTTKNLKITALSNTVLAVDGSGNVVATTTSGGSGSGVTTSTAGTANTLPIWTSASALGNSVISQNGTTTTIAASTTILGTGTTTFEVFADGHVNTTGTVPTVSSCGTSPSIRGTDVAAEVTDGSGTDTSCTVTFQYAYGAKPVVTVTPETAGITNFGYSYTTSTITVTGTSLTSDVWDYEVYANE